MARKHRKFHFSKNERNRVAEAVKAAESHTSAEIVPVVLQESSHYTEFQFALGIFFLLMSYLGFCLAIWRGHPLSPLWMMVIQMGSLSFGLLFFMVPSLKHLLIPRDIQRRKAFESAAISFIRAGLASPQGESSVLIFISILERQIYFLPDAKVTQKVNQDFWE